MPYQVLARKWRPKNFATVVGQEHVMRALTNALTQKRLHHAYLFSGTRGVGKTTIARILAKCLNCETDITATPCGKCDSCNEIDAGRLIDLIEVDAASRTKVEDTRDLLDNVQYLPTKSRYKIYIIDEVHMLSGHSFNALLKTLEEPPTHVKFLLATTDPQKLPITVLSRCLQFNLKALSPELIQQQMQFILNQEKIPYEDLALRQLAVNAKGSVRDALSLLDQAIAFGHRKITTNDVKSLLGTIDTKKIFSLLTALLTNDANLILEIINQLAELAVDFTSTIDELLEVLHQITICQLIPDSNNTSNWQHPDLVQQLATQITREEVQLYYQIGLLGKRDLELAPSPKCGFEMMMLRMLAFRPETIVPSAMPSFSPSSTLEKNTATKTQQPITTSISPSGQTTNIINPSPQNTDTDPDILQKLDVTGPTQALLQHCIINKHTANEIEIMLDPSQAPLLNKKHEERINAALSKYYQAPIITTIKLGSPNMKTLANLKKNEESKKQVAALQSLEKDLRIKEMVQKFDAKIITNTIKTEET